MNRRFFIITSCLISLLSTVAVNPACATKLNAKPLPSERELKDFENSQSSAPTVSRFNRRMDYRDEERARAEQAEQAKKDAIERAAQMEKEQVVSSKKAQTTALEANNRGVALGKQGRWTEAIQAHESAVQIDPQNKQYRINLSAARCTYGQARLSAKDHDAAAGLFRKSLAAAPDNSLASKLLNEALKKQGKDPGMVEERVAIGDQLMAVHDLESALIEYQTAMQLESSARTFTKMGDVALRCGQLSTAVNWYRQALVKDANFAPAHRQMGIVQLQGRDATGAASSLRKAIILDSKDSLAGQALVDIWRRQVAANPLLSENHLGLAGALQLTGDFNGAEDEYNKLATLEPGNPGLQAGRASLQRARQHAMAEKHKAAGETLFNQGLKREALAEIGQAVMIEPKNAKYQFLLGECLEANGDLRGAHQAYMTCVLIDPEKNQEAAYRMKEMQRGSNFVPPAQQAQQPMQQQAPMQHAPMQQAPMQHAQMPMQQAPMQHAQMPMQQAPMQHAQMSMQQAPMQQAPMQNSAAAPTALAGWQPALPAQKNVFEGGSGMPNVVAKTQMGFSTHGDESRAPQAQAQTVAAPQFPAQPQPQAQAPATPAPGSQTGQAMTADLIGKLSEMEAAKNHEGAIGILRDVLTHYLQNPDVHHRLAVNLLAAGNVTEAIAEFRIASALRPGSKEFAIDLARAMEIHKRSQEENAFEEPVPAASGKEVAAK